MKHFSVERTTLHIVGLLLVGVGVFTSPSEAIAQKGKHDWGGRLGLGLHRKPAISVYYGLSEGSLKDLTRSLAKPRFAEIKLGGISEDPESEWASVVSYHYNYFSLTNISGESGNAPASSDIETNLWRLGVGWDNGYGYGSGHSSDPAIILYHSHGMTWSRLDVRSPLTVASDSVLLALYRGTFRFGTKTEAGIRVRLFPLVMFDAAYERAIIFRRHLFWKWLGSSILEGGANWLLDEFLDKILESSPAAVPVVSFVLKNGLSFGVYQLRKEKMNFPFESEAPLLNDTFKFGVTFVF